MPQQHLPFWQVKGLPSPWLKLTYWLSNYVTRMATTAKPSSPTSTIWSQSSVPNKTPPATWGPHLRHATVENCSYETPPCDLWNCLLLPNYLWAVVCATQSNYLSGDHD